MVARVKKVQLQARRRSVIGQETGLPLIRGKFVPAESDWFPALGSMLIPEVEGARWLRAKVNDMVFEYRVVPASKKLPA